MPSTSLNRRQMLRQAFYYSAAAALANRMPALGAPSVQSGDLHFLMLGDFGSAGRKPSETMEPGHLPAPVKATPAPAPTPDSAFAAAFPSKQHMVAAAMKSYVETQSLKPEGLFLLGDNFYGAMKGGVASPRWQEGFEQMYPASLFPGPCWAMLGNHDYDEDNSLKLAAELSYADAHPGTRWTLPAKWYRVDWPATNPIVTCFILDSNFNNNLIFLTLKERAKQLLWLKTELEKPRQTAFTIALAHHPLYSNGPHGDTADLIKDWGPLFQKHNVAAYFCGHDHDLQHLEFDGVGTSFVVSGGGGGGLTKLKKPERKIFSQSVHGFTHLQVNREKLTVRHVDPQGAQLHAFSRDPAGKVDLLG